MKAMKPREIADCVGHYMIQNDLEGIVSMFHPDCQLVFPRDAPPQTGLQAVREAFAAMMPHQPRLTSEVTGELICGDTALLTANWRVESAQGGVIDQGSSTEVAKQKPDGSWVYFMDCPFGPPAVETVA